MFPARLQGRFGIVRVSQNQAGGSKENGEKSIDLHIGGFTVVDGDWRDFDSDVLVLVGWTS